MLPLSATGIDGGHIGCAVWAHPSLFVGFSIFLQRQWKVKLTSVCWEAQAVSNSLAQYIVVKSYSPDDNKSFIGRQQVRSHSFACEYF